MSNLRTDWRRLMLVHGLVALCSGALAEPGQAQERPARRAGDVATLTGVVRDSAGTPLVGAAVKLARSAVRVTTDSLGRFALARIPAGDVTLEVVRNGFPRFTMDLTLAAGRIDSVDVFLDGAVPAPAVAAASIPAPSGARLPSDDVSPRTPVERARAPRSLTGTVSDTLGRPLTGAIVTIVSQSRSVVTTPDGRYSFDNLIPGPALVRVRRIGYAPRTFTAAISNTDAVIADVPLGPLGQQLARVDVRSDAPANNSRLSGFFERRRSGFGQFLTRDQFEDRNPRAVTELMNRLTGVVAANDARGKRRIYGRGRCEMTVFLDGMNIIIPDGSSVDDFIDVYEVDAVEVHNRSTGLPAEFSGRTNACGVVAIWTRSRSGR